jgi:chromosomal replication initiator protein
MTRVTDDTATELANGSGDAQSAAGRAALDEAWSRTLAVLEDTVTPQQRAFIGLSRLDGVVGETALLSVPHQFAKDVIEQRLRQVITAALTDQIGHEVRVAVVVDPSLDGAGEPAAAAAPADAVPGEPATQPGADSAAPPEPGPEQAGTGREPGPRRESEPTRLNPRYLFETFVIGSSNRFAHAAAVAVAEAPAKAYNPLFIYGDSGLGKTHLLHAIGHYGMNLYAGVRVRYVSSEEFTNDFINSIRDGRAEGFRRRYRDVDILLVDDIQFLENKEQTQEEFFHTFNTLHNAQKQIVMTSDRPPKLLDSLEARLRSRFEWGLITDIQPPEFETRLAILQKKAESEHLDGIPDSVLGFIAENVVDNVRELEGSLIRVAAYSSLHRVPLTEDVAHDVLSDLLPAQRPRVITPQVILEETAKMFGWTIEDLCGKSRRRPLVTARQIGMYVFRELTDYSYPKIAEEFGGRDHTTVMHACEKIRGQMAERRVVFEQVNELINRIKHGASG